jgi:diaminohydroxyphosphoribosylaminopyrimidine deaminase / 5-amino-6-(5-phosphoribosylamino)uracil reductase
VQTLRARACAVLTGSGTVLVDDPRMNVRDVDIGRQPLRVVVDSGLRTPVHAAILPALIACHQAAPAARIALEAAGAEVVELPAADGRVDLPALLTLLAQRGVNELHVEAGAALNGALLAAGLIDEWVAYLAPLAVGDDARGLFAQPPLATLADAARFRLADLRQIGGDLRLTLLPA